MATVPTFSRPVDVFPSLPHQGGHLGPPLLSPYVSQPADPGAIDSPQIPRLTPQRRPVQRHRDPSIQKRPWSQTTRPDRGQTSSERQKGSGGKPLLSPPVHPKRQTGEQDLEDQHQLCIWIWQQLDLQGSGATYQPDMLAPSQVVGERK